MPVQLLVSPPVTGKTRACIERIRSLLAEHPLAKVWVVVPDRLQSTAFRRSLAEAGGAIGVQIGTFGDLYQDILARAGQTVPLTSEPIAQHLVKIAIDELAQRGKLITYNSIRSMPGFTLALHDRFAELKRALVTPETLLEVTTGGSPGIVELAHLYAGYQSRLIELGWADPEGLSWLAVVALQANPHLVNDIDLLIVDGFDLFIHTQHQSLKLLAEQVLDILITLPGSENFTRPAHRRFAQSLSQLKTEFPFTQQIIQEKPHLPVLLSHLEKNLFEQVGQICPQFPEIQNQGAEIQFLEGRSPAEEAREALRWIKARIVRDNIPIQACAIFTPDPQVYHFPLRIAAREFGLPLRFLDGEKLSTAPPIAVLLDLLKLSLLDFPRRLLLDTIRSPYFDLTRYELSPRDADVLDRVSQYGQVIQSLSQWDEVLDRLAGIEPKDSEGLEEDTAVPELPHGKNALALKNALHAFINRLSSPAQSQPTRVWTGWLEDLLDEINFLNENTTSLEKAARQELGETLRALVLSDTGVMNNLAGYSLSEYNPVDGNPIIGRNAGSIPLPAQDITYLQFVTGLETALQRATYQEQITWSQPVILVGSYDVARGVRFQTVALLGLAEGLFPRVERVDPFLDEAIRQRLGLEPRLGREQAGLFYQAVTRADRYLLLTRPYLAEDGERWEASPYWHAAIRLFSDRKPERIQPEGLRALSEAASPEEILFWAAIHANLPEAYHSSLEPEWGQLQHARRVLQDCQAATARGPYQGHTPSLAAELRQRYGGNHTWSASRLEAYGSCPYRFFSEVSLELQANSPPEIGFNAAQLGSLLHDILKEVYQQAQDPGDLESVLSILSRVALQLFKDAPDRFGFRPSLLWNVEQAQLISALEKTIRGISELEGGWIPIAMERIFGIESTPALELEIIRQDITDEVIPDGRIRLRGIIDRVDQNASGQLRVIDYKAGSSHMTARDLIDGRRLQLPLYALAARDALRLGSPVEGLYWAILANKAGSLKLSSFRYNDYYGFTGSVDLVRQHIGHSLAGIYQGVFPPQPPGSGCPAYCAEAAWCWRYTPER